METVASFTKEVASCEGRRVSKNGRLLDKITSGGCPFSIVASTTNLGSVSCSVKLISRSQPTSNIDSNKKDVNKRIPHITRSQKNCSAHMAIMPSRKAEILSQVSFQCATVTCLLQTLDGPFLDLANTLLGQIVLLSDLFDGHTIFAIKSKISVHDLGLAGRE